MNHRQMELQCDDFGIEQEVEVIRSRKYEVEVKRVHCELHSFVWIKFYI